MGCKMANQKSIKLKSKCLDVQSTYMTNKFCPINITYISKKPQNINFKNYQNIISKKSWKNILDFLPYQDLKETGKVNRKFNEICKCNEILLKFFKNKEEDISNYKQSFDSFSQLKISNYYSFCTNISINYN